MSNDKIIQSSVQKITLKDIDAKVDELHDLLRKSPYGGYSCTFVDGWSVKLTIPKKNLTKLRKYCSTTSGDGGL